MNGRPLETSNDTASSAIAAGLVSWDPSLSSALSKWRDIDLRPSSKFVDSITEPVDRLLSVFTEGYEPSEVNTPSPGLVVRPRCAGKDDPVVSGLSAKGC